MNKERAGKGIKILIGLPNSDQKNEIVGVLSQAYNVQIASDSIEAYQKIHAFDPDIAILDYSLSKINPINLSDGISFIHSNVYMVICVTNENMEVARRAWNRRALDFILKPYTTERFIQDVRKILRYVIQQHDLDDLHKEVQTLRNELNALRKQCQDKKK